MPGDLQTDPKVAGLRLHDAGVSIQKQWGETLVLFFS